MARFAKNSPPETDMLQRAAAVLAATPEAPELAAAYAELAEAYRALVERFYKIIAISDGYQAQVKELASELERMTVKLRRLQEVALPVCVRCHKVYAGDDYWQRLETYLIENFDILFSQGLCPDCLAETRARLGPSPSAEELLPARPHPRVLPKLARRFAKTISISDSFYSQLRDLNGRLELMARTDLLTGLANRWEMATHVEAERSRAERHGSSMALILGDLDHFKAINDTYGHLAGDKVLRAVAEVLRTNLRREDICARWGGEEFLVLLPETGPDQARRVAEKLGRIVRDLRIVFEERTIVVTMSFGVGGFSPGMSLDEWLKQVDGALYAAKTAGRDRVVVVEAAPR